MVSLILFDIDGTLIDTGGAGLIALNRTVEDLLGIENSMDGVNPAGKTDLQILREALAKHSREPSQDFINNFLNAYPGHLADALRKTNGSVKPGVEVLLNDLECKPEYCLGLLTGNLEVGAQLKLKRYSLWHYFKLGAYGTDDENRNGLVQVAIRKYSEKFGVPLQSSECVIIGDTPRDVECAQVNGSPCLAVATGRYDFETLNKNGADLVLPNLSHTAKIIQWLNSL